jgi:hypothetical protein
MEHSEQEPKSLSGSRASSAPYSLNTTTNGNRRRLNLRKPLIAPRTSDSLTLTVFGVRLQSGDACKRPW